VLLSVLDWPWSAVRAQRVRVYPTVPAATPVSV